MTGYKNGFEELGLSENLVRALSEMSFSEPFPIQQRAIVPMLGGKDIVGQAKTGSGKTAAFGLPLLQLVDLKKKVIQALVLSPTRELAVQITNEMRKMGKYTGVKIVTVYGGQSINIQREQIDRGSQIVVGTPGRIIDLVNRGYLDLSAVNYVVLDEADRMLDMGFIDDVKQILDWLTDMKQMALFSATMPEEIVRLASKYMKNPEKIILSADEPSVVELDQYYTVVREDEKLDKLRQIIKREKPESCLIFCRTKRRTGRVARELEDYFRDVAAIHGDLSQPQRERALNAFRKGRANILVATDVAARGIDIPGIKLVINYDFPDEPLMYFHRVGRTARAGNDGKSISLVTKYDLSMLVQVMGMTEATVKPLEPEDEERLRRPQAVRDDRRHEWNNRRSWHDRRSERGSERNKNWYIE
ncbi:MAG: DEAD/DEAH box helicase [Nitrososphaeria archaeon]